MAVWAVEQPAWEPGAASRFNLFKPPVSRQICSMLESLDGTAIVGEAKLNHSIFRVGEIDGTDDVPSMARSDLIWSMCAVFLVGTLILALLRRQNDVGTIDIYFDPKSLTAPHSKAWQTTLRQLVVSEARRFAAERGLTQLRNLRICRVEPVTKTDHLAKDDDKFSTGTWVADKLCSQFNTFRDCPRISLLDMTDSVRRTTQQFDGKPFSAEA